MDLSAFVQSFVAAHFLVGDRSEQTGTFSQTLREAGEMSFAEIAKWNRELGDRFRLRSSLRDRGLRGGGDAGKKYHESVARLQLHEIQSDLPVELFGFVRQSSYRPFVAGG